MDATHPQPAVTAPPPDAPHAPAALPGRDLRQGMIRGARGRCPACGEDLSAQRADDGPAYLTILIVSHLVGPLLLAVYMAWQPDPLVMVAGFCVAATVLSLLMLPRIKGGLVGFQWAKRMHGFGNTDPAAPDFDSRAFNAPEPQRP